MGHDEAMRRFNGLPAHVQVRVLAIFGHNLTIAARDTYEFQAPGVRAPQRLRDINEIQHRVFGHIVKLLTDDPGRYSDDVLLSFMLEHDDEHLTAQAAWALEDAFKH